MTELREQVHGAIDCRRTPGRDLSVNTMAPIMATKSTMPAIWK